jgi:hypothetical protein
MHSVAARRLMRRVATLNISQPWSPRQIEDLNANHSHIVLVCSNQVWVGRRNENLTRMQAIAAKNIAATELPVVVLGLGLHAALPALSSIEVPQETVQLLRIASERSRRIGVRGAITAELLDKVGVKNAEVIGCQSCFWHLAPRFTREVSNPHAEMEKPIAFNFTHPLFERSLVKFAMDSGFDVVGQSAEAASPDKFKQGSVQARWRSQIFSEGMIPRDRFSDWVAKHGHEFYDIDEWINHMQRYRFSYGTRLHGNMAALQAGVSALWIIHDLRTKELAEYLRLPSMYIDEAKKVTDVRRFFDRADYSDFIKTYPENYRRLYDYLEGAGVEHTLPAPIGRHADGGAQAPATPT